ncbi:uncharacterized protein V6R79_024783 [Siganus canaliculatus]
MKLYSVLVLMVTLSAAYGLRCYKCVGTSEYCKNPEIGNCPYGTDRCAIARENGLKTKKRKHANWTPYQNKSLPDEPEEPDLIHKVYQSKALYLRPSKTILELDDDLCKDDSSEENTGSTWKLGSSSLTQAGHSNASSDSFASPAVDSPPASTFGVKNSNLSLGCEELSTQTLALAYHSNMSSHHSSTSASCSSNRLSVCPSTSQSSTLSFGGQL